LSKKQIKENRTILFYDGDCGLCSRAVLFVVKNERFPKIYFSSIQSEFAKQFLKEFFFIYLGKQSKIG
jgi:predicted DCC family thiol-disulfide oxidoreductase YuxK